MSRFSEASEVNKRKRVKYIHEGGFVVEVEVELIEDAYELRPVASK